MAATLGATFLYLRVAAADQIARSHDSGSQYPWMLPLSGPTESVKTRCVLCSCSRRCTFEIHLIACGAGGAPSSGS